MLGWRPSQVGWRVGKSMAREVAQQCSWLGSVAMFFFRSGAHAQGYRFSVRATTKLGNIGGIEDPRRVKGGSSGAQVQTPRWAQGGCESGCPNFFAASCIGSTNKHGFKRGAMSHLFPGSYMPFNC